MDQIPPYHDQSNTYHNDIDQEPTDQPAPRPDPGSPMSRILALIGTFLVVTLVILWQNSPEEWHYAIIGEEVPQSLPTTESPAPGNWGQIDLVSRMFIRAKAFYSTQPQTIDMVMANYEGAIDPEDMLRASIMSAEYEGPESALERIADARQYTIDLMIHDWAVESEYYITRYDMVLTELDAIEAVYQSGTPDSIDNAMRDQLIVRYGILGHAVNTHGLADTDPSRAHIVNGFLKIVVLMLFAGLIVVGAFLVGCVLLIIGIIKLSEGKLKLRCPKPVPGGSVFLETYGIFVAGFAILSIGLFVLSATLKNPIVDMISLPLQWVLIIIPAWALIRGMNPAEWRNAIGLHRGEGIHKEIWYGFITYLASIPIFFAGVLITLVVLIGQGAMTAMGGSSGGPPEPAPSNPMFDMLAGSGILVTLLIFTLATIWAPIAEELIFRGALFRHLSGRLHWVLAGIFSALLFAYMHNYGPLMMAPLIALGFMFAFMRQWRGSIIAPIVAHFIHNASLLVIVISLVSMLSDPPHTPLATSSTRTPSSTTTGTTNLIEAQPVIDDSSAFDAESD